MKSSYRLFRIFGISVELHITFLLLLVFLFSVGVFYGGILSGFKVLILYAILFTIVVSHELVHSSVALLSEIEVPKITLLPIGGMASIDIPEEPRTELIMSLAGPLFNLVLAVIILIASYSIYPDVGFLTPQNFQGDIISLANSIFELQGLLTFLFYINVLLAGFNLLPIFPMDGGRVFRSGMALFIEYTRATEIAVNVGRFLSFLMIVFGLFFNLWLAIIAILIYFAGGQELKVVQLRHALKGISAGDAAVKRFQYVSSTESLREFLDEQARAHVFYYPVVSEQGDVIGMLSLDAIQDLDSDELATKYVRDVTNRNYTSIEANEPVSEKITKLLEKDFIFVTREGHVVGYLTPGYIMDLARFKGITRKIGM